MDFVFDIDKAVAAAAHLLGKQGGKSSVFVLMKMMYAAERYALSHWHRPITGDSFCSMKKGPVLSRTYDLIKGTIAATNSDAQKWNTYFSPREGNQIRLLKEPDFGFLSDLEQDALNRAAKDIAVLIQSSGLIADLLHQMWPEWKDPASLGKGSVPLELEDILSEVIEDEDEVRRVALEIRSVQSARAALQVSP